MKMAQPNSPPMGTAKQRARRREAQEPRKGQGKLNTSIVFSKPPAPGSPSRRKVTRDSAPPLRNGS